MTKKPKGDKTPKQPKAAARPSDGAPASGHNLTEATRAALLVQTVVKVERLKTQQSSLAGQARQLRAQLKAEAGYDGFEIDYALKLRKRDSKEMLDMRRREHRVAVALAHPIGLQADLFADTDLAPLEERAAAEGEVAGAAGDPAKPPYDGKIAQHWLEGWHRGQAALGAGIKKLEKAAPLLDKDGEAVTSGTPVTRASLSRQAAGGGAAPASVTSDTLDEDRDLRPRHLREAH